jgi:hypothetical protein
MKTTQKIIMSLDSYHYLVPDNWTFKDIEDHSVRTLALVPCDYSGNPFISSQRKRKVEVTITFTNDPGNETNIE